MVRKMKQEHRKSSPPPRILVKMGRRTMSKRWNNQKQQESTFLKSFQDSGKRLMESEQFIKLVTNVGKKEEWLNKKKRIKHPGKQIV